MKRKHLIISICVIAIVGLVLIDPSFAQSVADAAKETAKNTKPDSLLKNLPKLLHWIVGILSWAWVGFAALAGKLMTNDLVFGGAFHMDKYLFQMSTIMRNLANFGLGFGFIFFIGRTLWTEGGNIKDIVKQVGGFLLAGILVNASLLITQMLVDVSTIGVAAMGGMTEMFVGSDSSINEGIMRQASQKTQLLHKKNGRVELTTLSDEKMESADILDSILPKDKSMAGPFIYLGANVLNIQKYTLLQQEFNEDDIDAMLQGKNLALGFMVQLAIVGSFTMALFVLTIANLIRIGMIWILIALGPIFFLIRGLKRGGVKLPRGIGLDEIEDGSLAFSSFLRMIFLPVVTTMMMSLILIFSTTLVNTFHTSDKKLQSVGGTEVIGSTSHINNVIDLTYKGNFLSDDFKNGFADFIVCLMTILMVWFVAKYSIPKKAPIIGEMSRKIFDLAEGAMGSAPIIPVPGSDGKKGIAAIGEAFGKRGQLNPIAIGNKMVNTQKSNQNDLIRGQVARRLGAESSPFTEADMKTVQGDIKNEPTKDKITKFFESIKGIATKSSTTMTVKGDLLFKDEMLKILGPSIRLHDKWQTLGKGTDTSKPDIFFDHKSLIEKIVKELKNIGFTTDAQVVDLDGLKQANFIHKKTD